MIRSLEISGLALIDQLSVEFSPGFNVITGETGAGKSILIRALNLLLGVKASQDLIRAGKKSAVVSGVFEVEKDHPVLEQLEAAGIERQDAIFLRRVIQEGGRSQAWVNDVPVTLPTLKEVARLLIDIFSQHENQRLMEPVTHVNYLDRIGNLSALASGVAEQAKTVVECVRAFEETAGRLEKGSNNVDYLRYRLEELEKFNPQSEDFEKLGASVKMREAAAQNRESLAECVSVLNTDEGALVGLKDFLRRLSKLPEEIKGTLEDDVENIMKSLEEFSYRVERRLGDGDEGDLELDQQRLFKYQELIRKTPTKDIVGVVKDLERLRAEVRFLEEATGQLSERLEELDVLVEAWQEKALELSKRRKRAAKIVSESVGEELNLLAMAGARFEVQFGAATGGLKWNESLVSTLPEALAKEWGKRVERLSQVSMRGAEGCEFLLSANTGEAPKALAKIASGGELSRIMLALKKVLLTGADTCVMVFDEIDSGISGRVADIVGQKIRELSKTHQVLCISHLPQVSVYADAHLQVRKAVKKDRTESSIVRLSQEESAKEIARMLSGDKVSASSLENAKSLIAKAKKRSGVSAEQQA
ncbi:MAG: DNA repair protein RecN [Deltaproteobacteria bacterium]|nr:DNA repair protein RecN [Deltaproteobacteria bacterium]MBI3294283.1 DNA repair protein RecN [Deltaproteobacteria bacterium]